MKITQLPFNRFIGLETSPVESGMLISLPEGSQYTNHLGSVHASALLAVAEAASGAFLLQHLGDAGDYVPVVRRLEAKFRKPALGRVSARGVATAVEIAQWNDDLATRGRLLAPVPVEVVDTAGVVVLTAVVEWFIARRDGDESARS